MEQNVAAPFGRFGEADVNRTKSFLGPVSLEPLIVDLRVPSPGDRFSARVPLI